MNNHHHILDPPVKPEDDEEIWPENDERGVSNRMMTKNINEGEA